MFPSSCSCSGSVSLSFLHAVNVTAKAKATARRGAQIQDAIAATRAQSDEAVAESNRLKGKLAALENDAGSGISQPSSERREAALRNFSALKTRLAGLGLEGPFTWAEDLPFVRVPKSALKKVGSDIPAFGASGALAPWIREVLNLPDRQVTELETQLGDHLSAMDRLAANRVSVTNWVDSTGTYHNSITIPALEAEGQSLENALSTNLVHWLGPEQAQLVLSPFSSPDQWLSLEKVSHFLIKEGGKFELQVKPNDSDRPMVSTVLNVLPRCMSILVLAAGMIAQAARECQAANRQSYLVATGSIAASLIGRFGVRRFNAALFEVCRSVGKTATKAALKRRTPKPPRPLSPPVVFS